MLSLTINGKEIMKLSSHAQLRFHVPEKRGDRSWKVMDEETGKVVDSYTPPPKPKKPKPITPYKGSWAAMAKEGQKP